MNKVRVLKFTSGHTETHEKAINNFLSEMDGELVDIKLSQVVTGSYDSTKVLSTYVIIYKPYNGIDESL